MMQLLLYYIYIVAGDFFITLLQTHNTTNSLLFTSSECNYKSRLYWYLTFIMLSIIKKRLFETLLF